MKAVWPAVPLIAILVLPGCREAMTPDPAASAPDEDWSITAWGERYEVFAETDPLVAGRVSISNVHVTVLEGFTPLRSGKVTAILGGTGAGREFPQDTPLRDGIYQVTLKPEITGVFDLGFRIDGPAGSEDIPGGRVRVGTPETPGGAEPVGGPAGAGTIAFLKEQQWRTGFATAWVAPGTLNESVAGPGRVTPAAGGEVVLTAAVDAAVASDPWPYPGLEVTRGKTIFRILPRVGERSLLDLQADSAALGAEVEAARRRVERLTELLRVEATSAVELERARTTLAGLEARLRAAQLGVSAATTPAGSPSDASIRIIAPWSGQIAEVAVSPGQTVAAGAPLGRLVRVRPHWIVLALRPEDASRVRGRPVGLLLRRPGSADIQDVGAGDLRVISRSPEVDPRTATVSLIVEVDRAASVLPIGTAVEAELLLAGETPGIVITSSALVDDAGTMVVFIQAEGESFERREVRILASQGARVLVEGVKPGERLVMRGGGAIRRSALLSSGAPEGHVH